jgi:sugar-specific transcriptional regulator TrmB
LRKAAPNIYKAIETLEGKGALIADRGDTQTVRAVPAKEFLAVLERQFQHRRREAAESLSRVPEAGPDARIYQVTSREQLIEHCHQLLASAERIVLMDAFPLPLDMLRDDMAAAASRGVDVFAKVYAPDTISGVELILDPDYERTRRRWPEQWIDCVADGARYLEGLLSPDGERVLQAVRSASPYLADLHHSRLACELGYTALETGVSEGADGETLRGIHQRTTRYCSLDTPGYVTLRQRLDSMSDLPTERIR